MESDGSLLPTDVITASPSPELHYARQQPFVSIYRQVKSPDLLGFWSKLLYAFSNARYMFRLHDSVDFRF
jgi:hypothetical protein